MRLSLAAIPVLAALATGLAADLAILRVEPTPLFPRPAEGQPLRQQALLVLDNPGPPFAAQVVVRTGTNPATTDALGTIPSGKSTNTIAVPDLPSAARLEVGVSAAPGGPMRATTEVDWQPEKKWHIYCISYSHHDLGFGNYPHRLRTEIRHANIERPLQYCTETDAWDDDSRFRFVIETSEPITSFLSRHTAADADALARRVREGRIQIGRVHNTANTEQLGHELMARFFYLSGRHTPDLLGVAPGKTALIDDVIGLTWPFASALKAAGIPYLFHGYNGCGHCLKPAEDEPVFLWQGPDPDPQAPVLVRSVPYGGYAGDSLGDASPNRIREAIRTLGARWPYNALLLQDGTDFQLVTRDNADRIRAWNQQYRYPRLICATLDMFFDAVAAQADPAQLKTFAKDGNNQWADQDATDAWLLGEARRTGNALPAAEKFATIASVAAGGAYPWTDLYQAYHRLLLYHEHTDAIDVVGPNPERMRQYETELEENREMVADAATFTRRVEKDALDKLTALVATRAAQTLIVFNPMPQSRTDVVRLAADLIPDGSRVVDADSGRTLPWQRLPDGTSLFLAPDVPGTGYRSFSLLPDGPAAQPPTSVTQPRIESRFYRLTFNPRTGAIAGLWDKELGVELVDTNAPHQFNEYLFERFESPTLQSTSKWYRVESARLEFSHGPVADVATIQANAEGVERLTQTVVLYHNLKRIDFALDLVKSPSGRDCRQSNSNVQNKESAFVALPLAVPDFKFHHELPGGVAEPIRDQFDGSCTAYYAVRHFTDVANDRFGVTVSPIESALVEYGYPRSCPIVGGQEHLFERKMRPPDHSRLYLYLLDNMFDVNIRWDQRGPMRFTWSLRSHAGDWQHGQADAFGWAVHEPLLARLVTRPQQGTLPATHSFLSLDSPNVACLTLKPAEANGRGFIARFAETRGQATRTTVTFPFVSQVTTATETDLVENDRPSALPVTNGNTLTVALRPFEVKTIRLVCAPPAPIPTVTGVETVPVSDMQIRLAWQPTPGADRYHVYRGESPDFQPTLRHIVARPAGAGCIDQPELQYGGWIDNRIEPKTAYFYRIAAVDRWNNEGPASTPLAATTLESARGNRAPLPVVGLRAIHVSPIARCNFVNLLFRTACESDVRRYEIHRATQPGFTPADSTRIGWAEANAIIKGSGAYGHVPIDYPAGAYDHMMYQDNTVQPETLYYYRVRAVDTAGQTGPFSTEATVRTGPPPPPTGTATASSTYAPEYGAENAIDGSPDPFAAWISKPYGGGTKDAPTDAWIAVQFPHPIAIQGAAVTGDDRPVIPLQRSLRIDCRAGTVWQPAGEVRNGADRTLRSRWPAPVLTDAVRVYVPAADLPKSERPDIPDGVVRVCELLLLLPDGREVNVETALRRSPPQ
jgi:hypothetical protein